MNNEINNELNEIEVNDAETSDIFEEEVNLTRSESREQAFMLLFSKSFDDEPLEETIDDNSEMFPALRTSVRRLTKSFQAT